MLLTSIYAFFSIPSVDIKQCVHMAQNELIVVNHSGDLSAYIRLGIFSCSWDVVGTYHASLLFPA